MYDLAIANTFFQKNDQHLITYRNGDRMSTIDYIIVRRDEIRSIKDCKVIPGECVATHHRLVVMAMNVVMTRKPRRRIKQQKTEPREGRVQFNMSTKSTGNTGVCYTRNEL